jgi:TonB family protein
MIQRRKRNSSKVNLTISVIFHTTLILAVFFFAAREGMLGKKLKEITVTMVPKEKKPEPPKEKPAEPKVEPPKLAELPKTIAVAPPKLDAARSPVSAAPSVAPAAVSVPAFEFNDGAHDVQTGDANAVYKGLVELALRSHWSRPEDIDDGQFTAEVELTVDATGQVEGSRWLRGSGNSRWDNSVKAALAQTKSISRRPPNGFPPSFIVRFDVEAEAGGDGVQLSSR